VVADTEYPLALLGDLVSDLAVGPPEVAGEFVCLVLILIIRLR
jgi:hypothetical protein